MKKIIFLLLFLVIPQLANANTYIEKKIWDHTLKVVDYDLSSDIYEIKVIQTLDEMPLEKLLEQNNAITWVNGTFFCPTYYSWCNTDKSFTINEHYIKWEKFWEYLTTWDRAVFWWTKEKVPFIYQSWKINVDDEDKIYYWLANYPLIISDWKWMLEEYWDKWLIAANMKTKWVRNFVCSDKEKKHIYFWMVYNATVDDLATVLLDFWCFDALNLDAWASTAFIYNNRHIIWPNRDILDAVAIERKWIDTLKISKSALQITKVIFDDVNKKAKTTDSKIKRIDKYIEALSKLKDKFYEKYSTPIEETNIVWEIDKVWYKIEINELKPLKAILLINKVVEDLKTIKYELKTKK